MENLTLYNEKVHSYPIIINIPHSGTFVPDEIRTLMKDNIILPNSDWFLPELYDFMIDMGITIIASNINRYVIDLNRNPKNKLGESYKDNLVYTRTI